MNAPAKEAHESDWLSKTANIHLEEAHELDWLLKAANIRSEDANGIVRIFYSYR